MAENQSQQSKMPPHPPSYYRQPGSKSNWWIPLAIIGGFILLIIVFGAIFIGMLATSFEPEQVEVKENSVLHIDFAGGMQEYNRDNPIAALFGESQGASFIQTINSIKDAKNDDKIKGVYIKASPVPTGFAKSAELRDALREFKESGKFIYGYANYCGERDYQNLLLADKIYMPADGIMELNGYGISSVFMKEMFSSLGINFHVIQFEDYKSAGEQFSRTGFSDSARKQISLILEQRYVSLVEDISKSRNISKQQVRNIMNRGVYSPDSLFALGLIDGIEMESDVIDMMKREVYGDSVDPDKDKIRLITPQRYSAGRIPNKEEIADSDKQIAIIYGVGAIQDGKGNDFDSEYGIYSDQMVDYLRKARRDDKVKAVVLRVDSPGGSALASSEIWNEILKTREVKPVIASMSDVAASGGYYIAMACDTIVAHPMTVTGSIGVIMSVPNISDLMDKINIATDTISTSEAAQFLNGSYPYTDRDIDKLREIGKGMYTRFVSKAAESRGMEFEELRSKAKGRVWTGKDAKEQNLVDVLGGFSEAIAIAKEMIGMDRDKKVYVRVFPEEKDPMEVLLEAFTGKGKESEVNLKAELARTFGLTPEAFIKSWNGMPQSMKEQLIYTYHIVKMSNYERIMMALPPEYTAVR